MTGRVPEATLVTVADMVKRVGFPLRAKQLIFVMAGRNTLLEDLSGEGKKTLMTRM
jgi:hypothetical protein